MSQRESPWRKRISPSHLLQLAATGRRKAYAPYSHFTVGAALLGGSGKIYKGANVENASYGLTICAERAAVARAVGRGERQFEAIAVVGARREEELPEMTELRQDERTLDKVKLRCPPCGACRQTLAEFGESIEVVLLTQGDRFLVVSLEKLLPQAYRSENLE